MVTKSPKALNPPLIKKVLPSKQPKANDICPQNICDHMSNNISMLDFLHIFTYGIVKIAHEGPCSHNFSP